MGRFAKNYKTLREIAVRINDNLSKYNDLNEFRDDVNSFVSLFNETTLIAKKKDHIALRYLFTMINYGCLLFDEFNKLLIEYLHINDMSAFDIWKNYVEYMILFYDFRVFNYDVIVDAATHFLNKVKFDKEKYVLLLTRLINYHNDGIDDDYPLLDNNYNSELCKPLINFIEPALNGVKLCISEKEKEARDEEFRKMVYNNFKSSYKATISIKYNDKYKMEINKKYSHNLVLYIDMVLEDLKRFDNTIKDHEYTARMLRNSPSAYNLYLYLLEVVLGYDHYTCLNSLILDVIDNVELTIDDYLCHSRDSGKFFSIICKYMMLYFGIAYPKSEVKAMELLSLNMPELIKASKYLSILTKYMPYELHTIICNNPTNTIEFISKCLNPVYLNETKLIKALDSKNEEDLYEDLKYIKQVNHYIFNEIIDKYKDIYNKHVEIERANELEKQKQLELERQKKLEEEEKERKLQEELNKKAEASEKLKKSIGEETPTLSEEELVELIGKTDDMDAMWKVAGHYFVQASSNYNHYNLSYHYYCITGELGSSSGYLNAAISKSNYNNFILKGSDEYNENHKLLMECLSKTKNTAYYFFPYAFYGHDKKCIEYDKYVEETYKEIIDNPKTSENEIKLAKCGYYFYKDECYQSLHYFDEVKEYVSRSLLSIFTNRIYDEIYDKTKNIKQPVWKDEYINPFTQESYEYQKKHNAYMDATQYKAKAKRIIEWASNIGDVGSIKYKAYCLYYGIMNFEKNHKEAYDILSSLEASFNANDKTYKKILDDLKLEFHSKKRK